MTTVNITKAAEVQAEDIKLALRNSPQALDLFKEDVKKHIDFLEEDMRLGRPYPEAGPTAREILLYKRKILMRYDEPNEGVVEIFQFLWASRNK